MGIAQFRSALEADGERDVLRRGQRGGRGAVLAVRSLLHADGARALRAAGGARGTELSIVLSALWDPTLWDPTLCTPPCGTPPVPCILITVCRDP